MKNTSRNKKGRSLIEIRNSYTVLDLETTGLDPNYDEIIEIGLINIQNNEIVFEYQTLVKPSGSIDDFIESLTGISNEMLETAPPIEVVLPFVLSHIGTNIIVGHNVNFDINFMYDTCEYLGLPCFSNDFIDTMRISRRLFPENRHHRLKDLVSHFALSHDEKHRALGDAKVTNECYCKLKDHVLKNEISPDSLYPVKTQLKSADISASTDVIDESNPIFKQGIVFTGTLERYVRKDAMQIVADFGGINQDNVNKKTNYLVLGNLDYCNTIKDGKSNKYKKAEALKLEGLPIEIISEAVFYDMVEDE